MATNFYVVGSVLAWSLSSSPLLFLLGSIAPIF